MRDWRDKKSSWDAASHGYEKVAESGRFIWYIKPHGDGVHFTVMKRTKTNNKQIGTGQSVVSRFSAESRAEREARQAREKGS